MLCSWTRKKFKLFFNLVFLNKITKYFADNLLSRRIKQDLCIFKFLRIFGGRLGIELKKLSKFLPRSNRRLWLCVHKKMQICSLLGMSICWKDSHEKKLVKNRGQLKNLMFARTRYFGDNRRIDFCGLEIEVILKYLEYYT